MNAIIKTRNRQILYLILALATAELSNLIANSIGQNFAEYVSNYTVIPLNIAFVIIAILAAKRSKIHSRMLNFGIIVYAILSFVAEITWVLEETYLGIIPYPSLADAFYLIGYPFLFMFFIEYVHTSQNTIDKKVIVYLATIIIGIVATALFFVFYVSHYEKSVDVIIGMMYPSLDALVMIPAALAVILFSKDPLWVTTWLMFLGVVTVFVADVVFLYSQNMDLYYSGYYFEPLYYFSYIFFIFGLLNIIHISKLNIIR